MDKEFQELKTLLRSYHPKVNLTLVDKAWERIKDKYRGEKRLSGEATTKHFLAVAKMLASWKLDSASITAGFLHDSLRDGKLSKDSLRKEFGLEITRLVEGVSKITDLRLKASTKEEFIENLRKMILVLAKDLRVVLIKLADRLDNMQTLWALPPEKQKENALETLEIYAPLAERLGVGEIKGQLEDLAFVYAYPDQYKRLTRESRVFYKKAEKEIRNMKRTLLTFLAGEEIKAKVDGRKKHLYSLWRKLEREEIGWDFNKINDIVALRVLVAEVQECYVALGIIHNIYKPVPHIGVSDFIAQPKPNGYQSIHTKVFGPYGRVIEVQVRTHAMHLQAEYGVAAHWAYGEAKAKVESDQILEKSGVRVQEEKLAWIRELVSWQKELVDSEEFLKAVKFDVFKERNFVFSPKGDVFDLPKGATPIDFVFKVHTDLGSHVAGAKVDGRIVPLDYKLKSGEVIEIIKSKHPRPPSEKWLNFVVTTIAGREIKKRLRKKL